MMQRGPPTVSRKRPGSGSDYNSNGIVRAVDLKVGSELLPFHLQVPDFFVEDLIFSQTLGPVDDRPEQIGRPYVRPLPTARNCQQPQFPLGSTWELHRPANPKTVCPIVPFLGETLILGHRSLPETGSSTADPAADASANAT
ncbi:hypothetical protein J8F10_31845 [Gemmata sp. G18]|uniref:Uncharacterized protein n=1 Tax=Gemmata palustris TaxID=2822762 RepID=A0ABS5C1X5_9BACT|nr:hypothetical protein [Gemmata palustris]MBP3959865.1 hypothetical protein [Gemmata palustris]